MRRVGLSLLLAVVGTAALAAQEFHPPPVRSAGDGTRLGLLGFGVRGGIDLSGKTNWYSASRSTPAISSAIASDSVRRAKSVCSTA